MLSASVLTEKRSIKSEMNDLKKAKGVIYGLAIGDALGRLTEFLPLSAIKTKYGQKGITDLPDPALFTDDTQMPHPAHSNAAHAP